ncbi:MAG: glycoside hydrolase family 125 protein, partial [Lachnospiraceae bacterium]|nr:glycoside hydrolase family 125 protein [Lachnospiraceae bacterium]
MELTKGLEELLCADCEKIGDEKICEIYRKCFRSTWETTLSVDEDGSTFVITGDIGAMWLRDSSMQVLPYFRAISDEAVEQALRGLIAKQARLILTDAYANAFNKNGDYSCYSRDKTEMGAYIWERKYEVDSLAFPIMLLAKYVTATGRQDIPTEEVLAALDRVLEVWETEQRHETSPYVFERDSDLETETLQNQGRGTPTAYTGMTWSGFRPSDDACRYHYLVPSNMLAASALRQLCTLPVGEEMICRAKKLAEEISTGIYRHGIVRH